MDFFINTANAQAAGAGGGQSMLSALLLPVLLLVVFYLLFLALYDGVFSILSWASFEYVVTE